MNKFESAYRKNGINSNGTQYSFQTLKDGTQYIETEKNKFINKDGTSMSQRENL